MFKLLKGFLIAILATNFLFAQENKSIPNIEKIYLHTDRTTYTLGESLWYKAYSVYAYNHLLYSNSNVLYVELISPQSKIIAQHKIRMYEGLGHGDFKLTDSVGVKAAGTYQIRAYTNYSRNFGDDFVFKKNIEIMDVFDKSDLKQNQIKTPNLVLSNTKEAKQNNITVQFFPEGGSLLHNVESIIAFKAEDVNGYPLEVKGKVFDTNQNLVALFITNHDGMGKFALKPQKEQQYRVEIEAPNNTKTEAFLPKIQDIGYLLSFKKINDLAIATIKTNEETLKQQPNAPLTLVCTTRGVSYFEATQTLTKTTLSFQLSKNDFPEGITQATLYDASLKPYSERLIYFQKEHDFDITLNTDKKSYKPTEKVTVNLASKTKSGTVVPASFSLSCTDTNGINDVKNYSTNISSYFLIESDIKGAIHNPSYYFDVNNPKRLEHLDLLLLTQGWRDFLWKTIPKPNDSIAYFPEYDFTIAGHVKQLLGNKPKANVNITLALMNKEGLNILNTTTNNEGSFNFDKLRFYGETTMFLNSKNENGKGKGEIIVYPIQKPPILVHFKPEYKEPSTTMTTLKEAIYKKYVMYGVAPENVLDEVEIIAKKKKSTPSLYGMPDFSYVVGDETPVFNDIYQLIQYKIPGVIVDGDSIRFMRYQGAAHIILDGFPVNDPSQISFVLPDNVEKIDAIKGPSAAIFGSEGANGVIAIYTKDPSANVQTKKEFHNINQKIEGFYNARVFYSSNLQTSTIEADAKQAVRNTLYWNPYVHPDQTGVAQATYYNSDVSTTVNVTLEGITASGIPVVVKTDYIIER